MIAIRGILTGLMLQLAIGPIFIYIINIALQKSLLESFIAVIAATVVDYIYIMLAVTGVGKLLEKDRVKKVFGIISAIVLILFGISIFMSAIGMNEIKMITTSASTTLVGTFVKTFLLTISSPLTIVFWTGIFTARAIEYDLNQKELIIFGLSAGLSTILFIGSAVVLLSIFKTSIPLVFIKNANFFVGILLGGYGTIRLYRIMST